YHAAKEEVPPESETFPIGRAQVAREGGDLTLVAYGAMLRVAREAADVLQAEDGVAAEVLDLLTISPLDRETIVASVAKTGRAGVTKIHVQPGQTVKVGDVLVTFDEAASTPTALRGAPAPPPRPAATTPAVDAPAPARAGGPMPGGPVAATPATRRLARELAVDLRTVHGSGPGGRVTDADVRAAVGGAPAASAPAAGRAAPARPAARAPARARRPRAARARRQGHARGPPRRDLHRHQHRGPRRDRRDPDHQLPRGGDPRRRARAGGARRARGTRRAAGAAPDHAHVRPSRGRRRRRRALRRRPRAAAGATRAAPPRVVAPGEPRLVRADRVMP